MNIAPNVRTALERKEPPQSAVASIPSTSRFSDARNFFKQNASEIKT